MRDDAEEQIMFYVENLIVYPTDDDAPHVNGSGRGSGASSSGGRQTGVETAQELMLSRSKYFRALLRFYFLRSIEPIT